jgi:hypothetical protein
MAWSNIVYYARADGEGTNPPGYLHPGKRKHYEV